MSGYCGVEISHQEGDEGTVTTYEAVCYSVPESKRGEWDGYLHATEGCVNEGAYLVNGERACYEHLNVVVDLALMSGNTVAVRAIETD